MTAVGRHLLAAVDGTPGSATAADWAATEAARTGLPLLLVHAWGRPEHAAPGLPGISEVRGRALAALAATAAGVRRDHPSVTVLTELLDTPPPRGLLMAAESAEMIVLGFHRPRGIPRPFRGSVGVEVAAHCPRPVVLVPAGAGEPPTGGDIVVGVRPAHFPSPVLHIAIRQAERRAAPLRAVYAWTPPRGWDRSSEPERTRTARREVYRLHQALGREMAGPVAAEARPGLPAKVLIAAAAHAQLLVLGRSTDRLGPVAREVCDHVCLPVAIVPHT